jgi:exodeoxyribonuclease X
MFIFLDTETTDTREKDRLCQLAYKSDSIVNELFNPGMPISIDAMSVHHITNEMVQGKPLFQGSNTRTDLISLLDNNNTIIVAHNAKFDVNMLNREDVYPSKMICTLKLARHLDKDGVIPKYNLQYLRYYLGIKVEATAHDALGDILVLEVLFKRLFAKAKELYGDAAIDRMIDISSKLSLIKRMPFGKHKGLKMEEVPSDYLQWLSTTELDEDLNYTVQHFLKE